MEVDHENVYCIDLDRTGGRNAMLSDLEEYPTYKSSKECHGSDLTVQNEM